MRKFFAKKVYDLIGMMQPCVEIFVPTSELQFYFVCGLPEIDPFKMIFYPVLYDLVQQPLIHLIFRIEPIIEPDEFKNELLSVFQKLHKSDSLSV